MPVDKSTAQVTRWISSRTDSSSDHVEQKKEAPCLDADPQNPSDQVQQARKPLRSCEAPNHHINTPCKLDRKHIVMAYGP